MLIVGTAGHIDHGKTTLIHALTGMDTDRLEEEKRRGISIDLGFAHMSAPDGGQISFIDVPGHERFIKNMLAGVGGIGAVLLVVAADEGVKPQTDEHFEICRLLQISSGLIALTKTDAATPEQIASARRSIAALVEGSFLEDAAVIPVSARSGAGMPALKEELCRLATIQKQQAADRLARLNIDRSFAAKGFGTVVTGTLLAGHLRIGDAVTIHPAGQTARIRSLQVHGGSVDAAFAGQRTAVNLTGVEHSEIERGFVLTHVNDLAPTSIMDVSVEWLGSTQPPAKREHYLLHAGSAEVPAHLKMLGTGYARVWLSSPALLLPGDRFILRRPSPAATVGGGSVLDTFPPGRLNRAKINARLSKLEAAGWQERVALLVDESPHGRRLAELVKQTGLASELLRRHVAGTEQLLLIESAQRIFSATWLETARARLTDWLREFHVKNPSAAGAPIVQARLNLEPAVAAAVFANFHAIRVSGDTIALASHKPQSNPEHGRILAAIDQAFRQGGLQPPAPAAVLQQAGTDATKGRAFLEALIKAQRLIRVSDEIVFHADVIAKIKRSLLAQKGRRFSIPEFKEWTQVSRKYAVPLLEYLDRQHVTRREGDSRVIL